MVEVGQLEIAGSIDTSNIDQGFKRIKGGMKTVENQSNQTNASLQNMKTIGGSLAKTLTGIGIAGATAITALGTKSPVMANTLAKIDVSLLKLSNTVGRQLQPVFESFNGLINNFNSFISGGSGGSADSIFKGAVAGGGVGAIAGGIIGFMVAGPAGIIAGAGLGATIGTAAGGYLGKELSEFNQEVIEPSRQEDYTTLSERGSDIEGLGTFDKIGLKLMDVFVGMFAALSENDKKVITSTGVTR